MTVLCTLVKTVFFHNRDYLKDAEQIERDHQLFCKEVDETVYGYISSVKFNKPLIISSEGES